MRLAPTPWGNPPHRGPVGVTPFPDSIARILRAVLSTGVIGSADRSISRVAGALSCAIFGSSASASCAGYRSRWLIHIFAFAAHRYLLDGIPRLRLPGSAVYPRFRPLRTSRRPGGYAFTPAPGGRGLHPHGNLSYELKGLIFNSRSTRKPKLPFDQRVAPRFSVSCPYQHDVAWDQDDARKRPSHPCNIS
jgi:hypothetical protein